MHGGLQQAVSPRGGGTGARDPPVADTVGASSGGRAVTMECVTAYDYELALETDRLMLRPWLTSEAAIQHELWAERDPRVPPSRRIGSDGRPTVEDLAEAIRELGPPDTLGVLAIECVGSGEVIGSAGLIESYRQAGEPELVFELLRRSWGQGYATEAALAVLGWAKESGYRRVWATVADWNDAARRVLSKLGFIEVGQTEQGRALLLSKAV